MTPDGPGTTLLDRETSWLHFSGRVLQEAADPRVPLLERLFFCGIFSSNLDEYFRVRVASLRALMRPGAAGESPRDLEPGRLLYDVHRLVLDQQERYGRILADIFRELEREGIRLVDEATVDPRHAPHLAAYFDEHVRPLLEPVALGEGPVFLENRHVYLIVELWGGGDGASWAPGYTVVGVPRTLPRFLVLPDEGDGHEVMFLDDVIRHNLTRLFPDREVGRSYAVKLTRDAELYVEDDFDGDLVKAIRSSLSKRETGLPSRFLYDMRAPYVLVHRLQHGLGLDEEDLVLGGRYHNLHDLMGFPRFGRTDLSYPAWAPVPHPVLDRGTSVLAAVRERDQVVHTPYQSYDSVVRFLDEAAADPSVRALWLTVYRVSSDSAVLGALVKAARSGKDVTVFVEVQARFDEESNLSWADRLEAAGVRTLYSMNGLKVHAKIALVRRAEPEGERLYAYVGTGNFNEKTAAIYADHGVLTCDPRITQDVHEVFRFLAGEVEEPRLEHLLVAPFTLRRGFDRLIDAEAERARAGEPSGMTLKMNALEDRPIVERLYAASRAGVPIELIVRGICRAVPGVPGQSETVRARSILDRYLEHARIYCFHNGGDELMYLASADWMKRNLSRRVEVALPVYDPEVRRQLRRLVELQLADNRRARWIDGEGRNAYVETDAPPVRAQEAFRAYVRSLTEDGV